MTAPRVAVVVPWRAGDVDRENAWAWCRPWWEQFGWPIFEVEHPEPEPFNRSWCINEGARRAWPWDILVAIDADVFEADPQQVRDGVELCASTGRLTIPHTVGADLNTRGTQTLRSGAKGWEGRIYKRREPCTSRVWIIPRDLFAQVGGFDERFRGWGHEDVAAFEVFTTLRGVDQLPGTAWHLWHKPSFGTAKRTREWVVGERLVGRYMAAHRNGWAALEPIVAERTEAERWVQPEGEEPPEPRIPQAPPTDRGIDVIVLTAGRGEYLERTVASFQERVTGDIRHRTIFDDSGEAEYGVWLKETFPEFEIHTTPGRIGFTRAIREAWTHEAARNGSCSPYIFHLEEDFTFDRDVDLGQELIPILEAEPKLAQVALLRGPFYPPELEAGGIVEEDPGAYEHRQLDGRPYLVHRKFFTTNPSIYRRSLIRQMWPNVRNSETAYTRQLVRRGMSFAFLGDGEPYVTHIGHTRTNRGY